MGERERQRGRLRAKQTVTECTENKIKVHSSWGGVGRAGRVFQQMDDSGWNGGFPPFLLDAALEPTGVGAIRMDASGRTGRRGVDSYKA